MKNTRRTFSFIAFSLTLVMIISGTVAAQRGAIKTDTRILYHDGPVMSYFTPRVYLIWYGNWTGSPVTDIVPHFVSSVGSSPYFLINTTYPDSNGGTPNGALVYAGSVSDVYSQGPTLTVDNMRQIISDRIYTQNGLPLDTLGIYIIVASSDVTDIRPDGSTFCTPGTTPHHGIAMIDGAYVKYGFLGGANRCPTSAGPQFVASDGSLLPTPNGNFEGDAMVNSLANLLNVIVTNPTGTSGWFDRYGLENSDKCMGKFGETYLTPEGARANIRLAARDYLIQQNWINDRRGRCASSILD
jgi:hypothetical protein